MGRLTELIEYYSWKVNELAEGYEIATRYMETGEIKEYNKGCQRIDDTLEALKELQHYKDLEEQGRLIELPCKVGDTVYIVFDLIAHYGIYSAITEYSITSLPFKLEMLDGFDKTVFLTKEEAKAKLEELKGGGTDE